MLQIFSLHSVKSIISFSLSAVICLMLPGQTSEQTTEAPSISGTVTYGNAIGAPETRFVSNAIVCSASGSSPPVLDLTDETGQYTLIGFGTEPYTIVATKSGGANNITSFDAAMIAQHVAGTVPLTGNQILVADVSNNGIISSFDAAQIARYVTSSPPYGFTSAWRMLPASRTYSSVSANITGENYSALLLGEVSGNWTNTSPRPSVGSEKPDIFVDLPNLETPADKNVIIPVRVQGMADKGIISYEFDLRYDPTVIQPQADPVDVKGTVSRGLSVVTNATEPGLLRVVVYGAMPINENGVLLNLRFNSVGAPGSVSPLTFERLIFNEDLRALTADGRVNIF